LAGTEGGWGGDGGRGLLNWRTFNNGNYTQFMSIFLHPLVYTKEYYIYGLDLMKGWDFGILVIGIITLYYIIES